MSTTTVSHDRDTRIDVRLVISALWITTLFVFAYVDIFTFYRADVLEAALDGTVARTAFTVDQVFLTLTLVYVLVPILMLVLSLVLPARVNRMANVVVSLVYAITVLASCIGETWVYYVAGSIVEALLLLSIARLAWRRPA